jgi:hypothetical protein
MKEGLGYLSQKIFNSYTNETTFGLIEQTINDRNYVTRL